MSPAMAHAIARYMQLAPAIRARRLAPGRPA
jgi:hypothetical protein